MSTKIVDPSDHVQDPVERAIAAGFSVVPADMNKRPKVKWKQWQTERQTPEEQAALGHGSIWGLVTGALYGITVLDFDAEHGGMETLKALGLNPHVKTPGGAHVYVEHPGYPVKNSARKFPEYPGMDVRGDGGLAWFAGRGKKGVYEPLVWPPFPVILDDYLRDKLYPRPEEAKTKRAALGEFTGRGAGTAEAVRYLRRACDDIRNAPPGTSNAELNKAAFAIGGLIAAGQLVEDVAVEQLVEAAEERGAGDPETVVCAAIATGSDKPWKFEPLESDDWIPTAALKVFRTGKVPDATPFPVDALPDPLSEFVRQGSDSVSCPVDYLGAGLLPVLGVAIGGYVDLQVTETWRESGLVYVTLVGPPGARKSPAIDLLMAPVWEAEGALEEEARLRAESENPDSWMELEPPQLVVDDATIEALFGVLERNQRGVILQPDELTGWVGGMGQYKGGLGRDRQHWLSIWSRRPIKVNRVKGRSRSIRDPFVTVLGGIQPEPLEDLLHGKDDGLLPRLLMARGEFVTPRLRRGALDPRLVAGYDALWNRLRDQGTIGETVQFTPAGFTTFETWANEHYKTLNKVAPELAGAWAKMDGQCARLSLILARAADTEVTPDIVDRAISLVRYFQGQAVGLLQGSDAGSKWEKQNAGRLKALARYLQEHPGADRAELMAHGPEWALDGRTLDRLLESLAEMGVWHEQ